MRRKSVKKSSMFKVQAEKTVFKKYLDQVEGCATVRSYPHLQTDIQRVSETIYKYCYDFSQQTPFSRGLNYGCKTFGLSFPTGSVMVVRQWVPNAKEVYLLGDFNEFNQTSHRMVPVEEEPDIYMLELDMVADRIQNQSRLVLRIVDRDGQEHRMPPPSCKIRSHDYAYVCVDIGLPVAKNLKKHDIILAYTIDVRKMRLADVLSFLEANQSSLSNFNTVILRGLFGSDCVIDRHSLTLEQMHHLRQIVSKVKNELGLKIIIEWSFQAGTKKYPADNPIQKQLLRADGHLWHYDFEKEQVFALYLANISYFLSMFQIDGFHFKHIDSFCRTFEGQVIVRCMNIMSNRLHENGLTLASCKKEVPGLNQPVLEGGLGFTFTYNYAQNFLQSKTCEALKLKFDKILSSSNCVGINLDELTQEHELNFLFAVLASRKGIFCQGSLESNSKVLGRLFAVRKQPDLFAEETQVTKTSETTLVISRGRITIFFNFGPEMARQQAEGVGAMQLVSSFGTKDFNVDSNVLTLPGRSCCIFEQ